MDPSRLIVSLDVSTVARAEEIIDELSPTGCMFKIGLEILYGSALNGGLAPLFDRSRHPLAGNRWMFDFKSHDIGRTVNKAILAMLKQVQPRFFTIHTSGGHEMFRAASSALKSKGSPTSLAAVTILTSLDDDECQKIYGKRPSEKGPQLAAEFGLYDGCRTVVCGVPEVPAIRKLPGKLTIITPGISTAKTPSSGQARKATPAEAIRAGADYIVVGTSILQAPNPKAALFSIQSEMRNAHTK